MIIVESKNEAEEVLNMLDEIIHEYGFATVADLHDLVGLPSNYTDTKYGWSNLNTAEAVRSTMGYMIKMPKAKPIFIRKEQKKRMNNVEHPNHYQSETGMEVIDVIEAFTFDLTGTEAFDTGNVLKYMCRWKKKNGLEDLKKAKWYLEHLIDHVETLEKENNEPIDIFHVLGSIFDAHGITNNLKGDKPNEQN